jgi:hypothetical protein
MSPEASNDKDSQPLPGNSKSKRFATTNDTDQLNLLLAAQQQLQGHVSSPSRVAAAANESDQLRLLLAAQQQLQGHTSSQARAAATNESDQLRLLLAAQQLQGQSTDVSPSLVALLLQQQQQQQQLQNQLSPQVIALMQQQRLQQDQLLALQLTQLQQPQPQLNGLLSGLTGGNSLGMLIAQQQMLQRGTSSLLGSSHSNGTDAINIAQL